MRYPEAIRTVTYKRVLPRDLFNESKLLKCAGKLICLIEDEVVSNVLYEHDTTFTQNFIVGQDQSDGSFYLHNLTFYFRLPWPGDRVELEFNVTQDKTQNWNVYAVHAFWNEEVRVFTEDGEPTAEFLEMVSYAGSNN